MTTNAAIRRQSVSWIGDRGGDTVSLVEEDKRAVFKRAFASTLLGLRADSGIGSQKALADLIGTSEATYRRWENLTDANLPDAWQLKRLVEELKVEPDELVSPTDLTPREREMARRLARGTRRGQRRVRGDA